MFVSCSPVLCVFVLTIVSWDDFVKTRKVRLAATSDKHVYERVTRIELKQQ